MKLLDFTDLDGYIRHAWVRDSDNDARYGIPHNPPNLQSLGLKPEIQKELHNELASNKLFTRLDVSNSKGGVSSILRRMSLVHLRRAVLTLYKLER